MYSSPGQSWILKHFPVLDRPLLTQASNCIVNVFNFFDPKNYHQIPHKNFIQKLNIFKRSLSSNILETSQFLWPCLFHDHILRQPTVSLKPFLGISNERSWFHLIIRNKMEYQKNVRFRNKLEYDQVSRPEQNGLDWVFRRSLLNLWWNSSFNNLQIDENARISQLLVSSTRFSKSGNGLSAIICS